MFKQLRQAFLLLIVFTILTGISIRWRSPASRKSSFPKQANGSLIYRDGKPVASALIGQQFTDPKYFWSRPSATIADADSTCRAVSSGGRTSARPIPIL